MTTPRGQRIWLEVMALQLAALLAVGHYAAGTWLPFHEQQQHASVEALSPDGRWLATSANGMRVWDLVRDREAAYFPDDYGARFSPDSRLLIVGYPNIGRQLNIHRTGGWERVGGLGRETAIPLAFTPSSHALLVHDGRTRQLLVYETDGLDVTHRVPSATYRCWILRFAGARALLDGYGWDAAWWLDTRSGEWQKAPGESREWSPPQTPHVAVPAPLGSLVQRATHVAADRRAAAVSHGRIYAWVPNGRAIHVIQGDRIFRPFALPSWLFGLTLLGWLIWWLSWVATAPRRWPRATDTDRTWPMLSAALVLHLLLAGTVYASISHGGPLPHDRFMVRLLTLIACGVGAGLLIAYRRRLDVQPVSGVVGLTLVVYALALLWRATGTA